MNRELSEKIYEALKNNGATIGNASILIIQEVLDESEIKSLQGEEIKPFESVTTAGEQDKDNFAISFAVWCMYDPQAKLYQEARITAGGLLEKYKSRPYIDTLNTDKN